MTTINQTGRRRSAVATKVDKEKYPVLHSFIVEGIVRVEEDGTVVGVAADGEHVQIGDLSHLDDTEEYLQDHPTPYSW
jgi:hypothetical protein